MYVCLYVCMYVCIFQRNILLMVLLKMLMSRGLIMKFTTTIQSLRTRVVYSQLSQYSIVSSNIFCFCFNVCLNNVYQTLNQATKNTLLCQKSKTIFNCLLVYKNTKSMTVHQDLLMFLFFILKAVKFNQFFTIINFLKNFRPQSLLYMFLNACRKNYD